MSELEAPACMHGYTAEQVDRILAEHGRTEAEFHRWMRGQTMTLCDGRRWDRAEGKYVVHPLDLAGFLERRAVVD